MENVVFQGVRVFQYCAWAREYFFKIPFCRSRLWYFAPFKPISQTGILSYFDLGHFLGLHWLSGKNQDWAKKLACLATKFQFLRAGTLGNLSKGSAGLEILKIGHGLAKKRDFHRVFNLPTEICDWIVWIFSQISLQISKRTNVQFQGWTCMLVSLLKC